MPAGGWGRPFNPVHTCLHHHCFAGLHHSPWLNPSAHYPAAGQALCALERYDAAVEDLRQAVRLSPENEKVGGRRCCASVCMLNHGDGNQTASGRAANVWRILCCAWFTWGIA